jgi:hypothetical protein
MDRQEQQKRARELSLIKESTERDRKRRQRQGEPGEVSPGPATIEVERLDTSNTDSETKKTPHSMSQMQNNSEAVSIEFGRRHTENSLETYPRTIAKHKSEQTEP